MKPLIRMRKQDVLSTLNMESLSELAMFLGFTPHAGYWWRREDSPYLSELACYRLLEMRPEMDALIERTDENIKLNAALRDRERRRAAKRETAAS